LFQDLRLGPTPDVVDGEILATITTVSGVFDARAFSSNAFVRPDVETFLKVTVANNKLRRHLPNQEQDGRTPQRVKRGPGYYLRRAHRARWSTVLRVRRLQQHHQAPDRTAVVHVQTIRIL